MMPEEPSKPERVSEHLANERTYLAWLRTSISILTLGFATNRFAAYLLEFHVRSERELPRSLFGGPRSFGLGMVVLGSILMITSAWHYQRTKKGIESGDFRPNTALLWAVSALSVALGIATILLLLQTK